MTPGFVDCININEGSTKEIAELALQGRIGKRIHLHQLVVILRQAVSSIH